ncbi:hypothetical protein [Streptomyces sp. NRRL S-1813]|uniref:hypothetical protein n=1 Tax=Streptomyces sp. NRRL S-1813 TaxID=1463888 RepID=UPI00131E5BFC|nr:hypothetical protein [Streptomyces sp. NRRL S-1813]
MPLNDLRYTTGLSGTPGTFSAEHCHAVRSGRVTSLTCTGSFVAADGRGTDHTAQLIDVPADHDQPARHRVLYSGGAVIHRRGGDRVVPRLTRSPCKP